MADFLTERQKQILDFIHQFRRERGIAPTYREIRDRFDYSSYGTVYKHLRLLAEKGYLEREWNQKRGLRLRESPEQTAALTAELPFLGRIAAGRPIEALPGRETLTVPLHLLGRAGGDDHFVLKVVGESMIDEGIFDGDLVVVLRRERAELGDMVVALVGDEVTLKRFYLEGDTVRLQPANPTMEPLRVRAGDVRIQGIVVGLMRRF